jgi:hypothetical protein
MVIVLELAAILELAAGVLVLVVSRNVIHEILGALAVGFAVMTFGLAGILAEVRKARRILEGKPPVHPMQKL